MSQCHSLTYSQVSSRNHWLPQRILGPGVERYGERDMFLLRCTYIFIHLWRERGVFFLLCTYIFIHLWRERGVFLLLCTYIFIHLWRERHVFGALYLYIYTWVSVLIKLMFERGVGSQRCGLGGLGAPLGISGGQKLESLWHKMHGLVPFGSWGNPRGRGFQNTPCRLAEQEPF